MCLQIRTLASSISVYVELFFCSSASRKKPSHVCVLDCKRPLKITAFQGIVNLNEYVQRVASPSAQRQ